jgi:hypothetical protein
MQVSRRSIDAPQPPPVTPKEALSSLALIQAPDLNLQQKWIKTHDRCCVAEIIFVGGFVENIL